MNLPSVGHEFSFKGDTFTIGHISGQTVRFSSVAGGRERIVKLETFLEMMESDDFIHENEEWAENYTNLSKEAITKRNNLFKLIRFIESHTHTPCSQKKVGPLLEQFGKKHNVKVMSASNFAKTYRRYVSAGYNINALVPNHKAKGNRKARMSSHQQKVISEVLHEKYFKRNGATLKSAYKEFRERMFETEEFQRAPNTFKRASYASFRRRALEYDISYRLTARFGKKKAQGMLRASGIKHEIQFPLYAVEADGYVVDCFVVDPETGESLTRPYLTLFIDRYTRAVLSFHLSLRAFCIETLMVAFKDALRQDNGLPGGRISQIIVDNGSDFKSNAFRAAVLSVGSDLKPCRVQDPNSKPFVESIFRTFNLRCFHELEGTTFSDPKSRGDYKSEDESIYTIDDLNDIFNTVVDDYHRTIHTQLEQAPLLTWQDWLEETKGFVNEVPLEEINKYLRDVKLLKLNKGTVRFDGLQYKSHDLRAIEEQLKLRNASHPVHVYIDNSNLAHVYVENPLEPNGNLIKAVSTEPERTKNLTMFDYMQEREAIKQEKEKQIQRLNDLGSEEIDIQNKKKRQKIREEAWLRTKRLREANKKQSASKSNVIYKDNLPDSPQPLNPPLTSEEKFEDMVWENDDE